MCSVELKENKEDSSQGFDFYLAWHIKQLAVLYLSSRPERGVVLALMGTTLCH